MIELSILQAVREIVTIVGVIAGLTYYIMTVRNQNKARQIQLIAQLADFTSAEAQKRAYPLLSFQWEDYNDFERKYGSDTDVESYAERYGAWSSMNRAGFLLKEGLITMDILVGSLGGQLGPLWQWRKFESIIMEQRVRYKMPLLFVWWEYLAGEIERYYEERGYTDLIPENLGSYVPDE
jgi:hypothetical protein